MSDADTLEQVVFQALLCFDERGNGGDPRHGNPGKYYTSERGFQRTTGILTVIFFRLLICSAAYINQLS